VSHYQTAACRLAYCDKHPTQNTPHKTPHTQTRNVARGAALARTAAYGQDASNASCPVWIRAVFPKLWLLARAAYFAGLTTRVAGDRWQPVV